jgi:hypothetical protein
MSIWIMVATLAAGSLTLEDACRPLAVSSSGVCELSESYLDIGGGTGGYDAVSRQTKRRPPSAVTMSEDRHLDQTDRRRMIGGVRTLRRNFSVAAWMIRRHLDFVSAFRFQSHLGNDDVDDQLERLVRLQSRPAACHNRGRFGLPRMIRMAELLRTVDGDMGWLKLSGGHIQLIEGDRIRDPVGFEGFNRADWRNGVRIDDMGRSLEYGIHRRIDGGSGLSFERVISARNMRLHGYFDREDQLRGVSPLATAYNEMQDVYEIHDYTRARAKVQSLFSMVFFRQASDAVGDITGGTDEDGDEEKSGYEVSLGKGPLVLDLDPGDDAKFLESGQPSSQLQAYVESVLILALKALDLPYSFLREDFTNFFGSRGAWLLYDRACESKREDNQELLDDWTEWQMRFWIQRGDLMLPPGVAIEDHFWEWIPRKVPWWKPQDEIKASLSAIDAGLTTPQRVCRENDQGDWYENVLEIKRAREWAAEHGVPLSFAVTTTGPVPDDGRGDDPRKKSA